MSFFDVTGNIVQQMTMLQIPQYITDNSSGEEGYTDNQIENPDYILNQNAITSMNNLNASATNYIKTAGNVFSGNTTSNPCPLSLLDIGGEVGRFLNDLGDSVSALFNGTCSALMNILNNFGNLLGGIASDIFNGVINSIVPPDLYFTGLQDLISQIEAFSSKLTNVANTVSSTVSSIVTQASSGLSSLFNTINCLPSALSPDTMAALNSVGSFGQFGDLAIQINNAKASGTDPIQVYNSIKTGMNKVLDIPRQFNNLSNLVRSII